MKTLEEKLKFKSHFAKLGQGRIVPSLQIAFWKVFWEVPESGADILDLITPDEIKEIFSQNKYNLIVFVRMLSSKIIEISKENKKLVGPQVKVLLNCIRFLTKLSPFLFELKDCNSIEENLFWSNSFNLKVSFKIVINDHSEDIPYLGSVLVTSLIDLLFTSDFTVDPPTGSYTKKNLQIWELGIGSSKPCSTNHIYESNRSEIIRLLLALCSQSMYQLPSELTSQGSKFSSYVVTSLPKLDILTLCYSLFNLVCRSAKPSPENGLDIKNADILEMKLMYISHSIHLLTYLILYPIPLKNLQFLSEIPGEHKLYNFPRRYFAKFQNIKDLTYIVNSLTDLVQFAIDGVRDDRKFTITRSNQPSLWTTQASILLWELIQSNTVVKLEIKEFKISHLMVSLLYNITSNYNSSSQKVLVKQNSYFLLYLSSNAQLFEGIFELVDDFYDDLPNNFKLVPNPVTFRDFLVIQLCQFLIFKTSGLTEMLALTLVEILYNLIVVISSRSIYLNDSSSKKLQNPNPFGGLSYPAASAITQLIAKYSQKPFLMEKFVHSNLLAIVLRAVTTSAIKYPKSSRMLIFSILKNEKVYSQTWNNVYSFTSEYFEGDTFISRLEDLDENESKTSFFNSINPLTRISSNSSDTSISTELELIKSNDSSANNSLISFQHQEVEIQDDVDISMIELSMRPKPLTGMSEKSVEKLLMNSPIRRSWGGADSLRIILTVIIPYVKLVLEDFWNQLEVSVDAFELISMLGETDFYSMIIDHRKHINFDYLPESPLEMFKFSWSPSSLSWYISLLFTDIYYSIDQYNNYSGNNNRMMKNLSDSLASVSKFTSSWTNSFLPQLSSKADAFQPQTIEWVGNTLTKSNIYLDTDIKLFKIDIINKEGFFSLSRIAQITPGTPTMHSERPPSLTRRVSDLRLQTASRVNQSSNIDDQDNLSRNAKRNSITSLHSLNTLNRTRSNTPRNSISYESRSPYS